MRITSNYEDIEMNQWDRTMRMLLKRIEELESKLEEYSILEQKAYEYLQDNELVCPTMINAIKFCLS